MPTSQGREVTMLFEQVLVRPLLSLKWRHFSCGANAVPIALFMWMVIHWLGQTQQDWLRFPAYRERKVKQGRQGDDTQAEEFLRDALRRLRFLKRILGTEAVGVDYADVLKALESQKPLDQNGELITFGPSFGEEAMSEFASRLRNLGLKFIDDFFCLSFDLPEWCGIRLIFRGDDPAQRVTTAPGIW